MQVSRQSVIPDFFGVADANTSDTEELVLQLKYGGRPLALHDMADGLTVLVVDDDPDSRKLVAVALGPCGATVLQATSVAAAMSSVEQTAPDVIISDIGMPNEDGIDLAHRVPALDGATRRVPMVALTAFTSGDDRRRILAAGFDTYLSKPVAPLALRRVLADFREDGGSPATIT